MLIYNQDEPLQAQHAQEALDISGEVGQAIAGGSIRVAVSSLGES
jgi:hypothetical protein